MPDRAEGENLIGQDKVLKTGTFGILSVRELERGGGEIRTHDRVAPMPVFKTGAFSHSATPPNFLRRFADALHVQSSSATATQWRLPSKVPRRFVSSAKNEIGLAFCFRLA